MSEHATADTTVDEQLQEFADAVTESEPYRRFLQSQRQLKSDAEAQALLQEFREKRQQLQRGGFDQETMGELRRLKEEMSENETIDEVREAEDELTEMLQRTNDIVSERIGEEFAQTLGGGCC